MGDAPKKTIFTYELDSEHQKLLLEVMDSGVYRPREVPYSERSIEGEKFNATLYSKEKRGKRKFCVQGAGAAEFVEFVLEPQGIVPLALGYEEILAPEAVSPHAGSDESGKGDYFGPLVVATVYVDEDLAAAMKALELKLPDKNDRVQTYRDVVRDCKQLSDRIVLAAGAKLRELLGPNRYSVVRLGNPSYNRLYAKIKNANRLLAWAHGTAIEDLLTKVPACPRVVVDQFARIPMLDDKGEPMKDEYGSIREDVARSQAVLKRALKERGKKVELEQRHKAESDIAVAAASIIAREVFLREIAKMSAEVGETIPIGSSDPRVRAIACEMVKRSGPVWLMNHAKVQFQTTDKVLSSTGHSRADLPPEGQVPSSLFRT